MSRVFASALLLAVTGVTGLAAQVPGINLYLFPRAGVYRPLGALGEVNGQTVKLKGGTAVGLSAEVSLPVLPFNLRGSLDYALGVGDEVGDRESDADHTVLALTADLVLRLTPGILPTQAYLVGGVGTRQYDFDSATLFPDQASNLAFHLGAGAGVKLGPLTLLGEVSDYISRFELRPGQKTTRNDVFAMVGFRIGMF